MDIPCATDALGSCCLYLQIAVASARFVGCTSVASLLLARDAVTAAARCSCGMLQQLLYFSLTLLKQCAPVALVDVVG